jgi:hypothetical protein
MTATRPALDQWPALRVADWTPTRETLHMWTQSVGKIRLAAAPMVNHWWQVPLYVSARGLTTSAIFGPRTFDIEFDFVDHLLRTRTTDGVVETVALGPKSVAEFYAQLMDVLRSAGIDIAIRPTPVEVPEAIPFAENHANASYDPEHARRGRAARRVRGGLRAHGPGRGAGTRAVAARPGDAAVSRPPPRSVNRPRTSPRPRSRRTAAAAARRTTTGGW